MVKALGNVAELVPQVADNVSPCDTITCPAVPGSKVLPNLISPSKFKSVAFIVFSPVKLINYYIYI